MTFIAPLPQSVRDCLIGSEPTHPGLWLDKYAESWSDQISPDKLSEHVQKPTVDRVAELSRTAPVGVNWDALFLRWRSTHEACRAHLITATTTGPLTLHLARASALENAGICLHPIYGFVYLPGSGLKGMARAYAETVWLPAQPEDQAARHAAWERIEDVFGWAPNPRRNEVLNDPTHPAHPRCRTADKVDEHKEFSGGIVFHDAWPAKWPALQADILNSHHGDYYGAAPQDNSHAPGDWEGPNMVSFLAVGSGVTFQFPLSKRRREVDPQLFELAAEWLAGALQHLGAGAKTSSGYGAFQIVSDGLTEPEREKSRQTWTRAIQRNFAQDTYTLELVTPAFLAGPHPDRVDLAAHECTLRPSTLRGQLRSWWRTMHAAWLTVSELRQLEALVWGDTNHSGAVRVTIVPCGPVQPMEFDRRKIIRDNKLPEPPNKKTTQGLTYHSYGMDETRGRRFYLSPGTKWTVTVTARGVKALSAIDAKSDDKEGRDQEKPGTAPFATLSASEILQQAQIALALLSRFGGVGSKSRKGFGNFALDAKLSDLIDEQRETWDRKIRVVAQQLRQKVKQTKPPAQPQKAASPALEFAQFVWDVAMPWPNYWFALDQVGDAAQRFSQSMKHNLEKKALGLPRNVRAPFSGSFRGGSSVSKTDRHASPIHYHLTKGSDGKYRVTLLAFPSAELPTFDVSQRFLNDALPKIQAHLIGFITDNGKQGQTTAFVPRPPAISSAAMLPAGPALPQIGERVKAVLSIAKTSKGSWKAKHVPTGMEGPIQNSGDVPKDKQAGDEVELTVKVCDARQIAFRYPTETAVQSGPPNKPKKQGK